MAWLVTLIALVWIQFWHKILDSSVLSFQLPPFFLLPCCLVFFEFVCPNCDSPNYDTICSWFEFLWIRLIVAVIEVSARCLSFCEVSLIWACPTPFILPSLLCYMPLIRPSAFELQCCLKLQVWVYTGIIQYSLHPSSWGYCAQPDWEIQQYIHALNSTCVDNTGIVKAGTAHNLVKEI